MDVEVTVPAEYQNGIMGGIQKRRGSVTDSFQQGDVFIVRADVPLSSMFGYATELRGLTQGLGEFGMEYKNHQPVSEYEVQHIVEAYQKKKKEKDL